MKIGVFTTGLTGIVNASLHLVDQLQKEGHEVVYFSPLDLQERLDGINLTFIQLPKIDFTYKEKYVGSLFSFTLGEKRYLHSGLDDLNIPEIRNMISDACLDRVIVDIELHEVTLASIAEKVQLVILTQWFCNRHFSSLPPLDTTVIPWGIKEKLLISLRWRKREMQAILWRLKNIISKLITREDILRYFARSIGYPNKSILSSDFPPIFDYKELSIISTAMKEMEFPTILPPNLHYIGPVVYAARDQKQELPFELRDKMSKLSYEKLIYCSMSSHRSENLPFVRKIIKAVRNMNNCLIVISLSNRNKDEVKELITGKDNVFISDWLPQLSLLEKADLSINHGGIHTINECIVTGTPMLVYSGKMFDQNGCAARVQYNGLGLSADKDMESSEDIREKIEEVLYSDSYRDNVAKIRKLHITKSKDEERDGLFYLRE